MNRALMKEINIQVNNVGHIKRYSRKSRSISRPRGCGSINTWALAPHILYNVKHGRGVD